MIELPLPGELGGISLARAIRQRRWLANASCVFSIAAVTERTARRYGTRAERYVQLEAGHVTQNVLLMAAGLSLAMQVAIIYIPFFEDIFRVKPLGLNGWITVFGFSSLTFIIMEAFKYGKRFGNSPLLAV